MFHKGSEVHDLNALDHFSVLFVKLVIAVMHNAHAPNKKKVRVSLK
jgi:hypothetical protein